jgi:transposase
MSAEKRFGLYSNTMIYTHGGKKMWCIPVVDQKFRRKMDDVLAVYELPYNPHEPVICLDEKPIQLLSDQRKAQTMRPGGDARRDYEYQRCGTANVFYAVEPKTGRCSPDVTQRRTCEDFAKELQLLERRYHQKTKKIHLILDNLSSHSRNALRRTFGFEEGERLWSRFDVHFTPTHASWLNQAENGISKYTRGCLGKRRIADIETLRAESQAWSEAVNRHPSPVRWKFTREKAKKTFSRHTHLSNRKTFRSED